MTTATILGIMSGTSLDGISVAAVRFTMTPGKAVEARLLSYHARDYTSTERDALLEVIEHGNTDSICRMNFTLGELFAAAAVDAMARANLRAGDVHAIASHGQTVWHVPGIATLQLGEAAVIAERTGCAVISDFRVRDVAAGGHGAPLVPIADSLLFSHESQWRALQNIGGIGNVTVVPPRGSKAAVRAFDTGPGMVLIDGVVARLTDGAARMDTDGQYSAGGRVLAGVVDELLRLPFFAEPPPRSTGRELFNRAFIEKFIADCRLADHGANEADIVATAVSVTARSIAESYRRFVDEPIGDVLLCGGGSRHPLLAAELSRELAPLPVHNFEAHFFIAEAKEAVAFALLGFMHLNSMPGNVPTATGARGPRILGKHTPA